MKFTQEFISVWQAEKRSLSFFTLFKISFINNLKFGKVL